MAKKTGGLNLAGSADPSIVQAATKYGFAGVPKDLSKQFGMIAQGYSQQMAAFGQVGAKLGAIAGQLAGPLVDKAIDNIQFEYSKSIKNPGDIPQPSIDAHMDLNKQIKEMLKSDDATIVEQGKNLKAQWMYNADRIRAGLMTVDLTAGGALSDAMKNGQYNNDLLFYNASQAKGAPISADSGLPEEYHGVQMLPTIDDGKIKYGLFKDDKPISGISETGEIQYADDNNKQYILGVDDFNKNIVTESAFRAPVNAFTNDIIKNAQKGGKFDETMLKNSILSLKVDGKSITSKDVEDMSHFLFPGVTETFSDHLGKINPTTAAAYIEANPSILSNLKDITGDGEININPDDDIPDDISFEVNSEGFTNMLNGMKKDKNAFADWYTGELKKKHDLNLKTPPPPPTSDKYEMPGGQYTDKTRVDRDVKLLNEDPNTIPEQIAWNNLKWRKQNGQYQVFDTDKGTYVNTTKNRLRLNLSFDETVGYKVGTSSTSEMTAQEANSIINNPNIYPIAKVEEAKALLQQIYFPVGGIVKGKKLLDE
jgi:hypothetical protein